ncbi:MAG: hypothetical protein ACRDN6_08580 [Gaiellaceae bacterium]
MDAARIRIEAPDEITARCLQDEAKGLFEAELAPLGDGRWELRMVEAKDARLSTATALNAVQRWLAACQLAEATLYLDGKPYQIEAGGWIPPTREQDLARSATPTPSTS